MSIHVLDGILAVFVVLCGSFAIMANYQSARANRSRKSFHYVVISAAIYAIALYTIVLIDHHITTSETVRLILFRPLVSLLLIILGAAAITYRKNNK